MVATLPRRFLAVFEAVGADPGDDPELRLQKRILVAVSVLVAAAAVVWGLVYVAAGEPVAGAIPLTYSLMSAVSLALFAVTNRYRVYRTTQLATLCCCRSCCNWRWEASCRRAP